MVTTTKTEFNIRPNPAHGSAQIEYKSDRSQNVKYTLTDIAGRLHHSSSFMALPGNNSELIDVSDLPNGLYFVKLVDEFGIAEQKLTIN